MLLPHILGLGGCGAAGAALLLWGRRRRRRRSGRAAAETAAAAASAGSRPPTAKQKRKKPTKPADAAAAAAVAAFGPAAAAIPPKELATLASIIHEVHAARGWRTGGYPLTQAWLRAEARAMGDAGGGWAADFEPAGMTDDRVARLVGVIDEELLGGLLVTRLTAGPWPEQGGRQQQQQQQQRPPLTFRVLDTPASGWLACFQESGALLVNRPRWAKDVTRASPVNCEGVVCASRLQMLLHTLAHELVHAVVFYACPDIDASCPAYLENDRHGPVFALLNKQLFGHTSTALERCNARAGPSAGGGW
jgi:hypothetical protein